MKRQIPEIQNKTKSPLQHTVGTIYSGKALATEDGANSSNLNGVILSLLGTEWVK